MKVDVNKYKIMEERYDRNFNKEIVVRYEGAILDQMKNLFYAVKGRTTVNTIRMYLCDLEGNVIESTS